MTYRGSGNSAGISYEEDNFSIESAASPVREMEKHGREGRLRNASGGKRGQSGVWYMHVFSQRMHGVCFCKRRRGEKTYFRQACMRREGPVFSRRKGVVGFSVQIMEKEPAVGA